MGLELAGQEANRDNALAPGRPQQAQACRVARGVVFEVHPAEPGKGIAHVGRVVDRQTPAARRIDVGKGPIGQSRAVARS
jgi:hypothetical protein